MAELIECLLAHPNIVVGVNLSCNQLTDEAGVKMACYVAASSTVRLLSLANNQFSSATYLAMAAAMRVNTSLQCLYLCGNQAEDKIRTDATFVETLRVNPSRPASSVWWLYSRSNESQRLQNEAAELGHPSLQLLLCAKLDHFTFQTTRYF
jgi:Leucine-rich repeat (LRR) protein